MRKMSNGKQTVTVKRYIILKNFWEYYIIKDKNYESPIQFAYVMGSSDEFGSIDLNEIKPYIMGDTIHLKRDDIFPASGWYWVN